MLGRGRLFQPSCHSPFILHVRAYTFFSWIIRDTYNRSFAYTSHYYKKKAWKYAYVADLCIFLLLLLPCIQNLLLLFFHINKWSCIWYLSSCIILFRFFLLCFIFLFFFNFYPLHVFFSLSLFCLLHKSLPNNNTVQGLRNFSIRGSLGLCVNGLYMCVDDNAAATSND